MNKLAKNSILYSTGTLVPQMAAFILLPIYTRYLSPAEYGILNAVQVVNSVLAIVFTLSIDKAIYRLYFDFKSEKDKKDYLGTIFFAVTTCVVILTTLMFIFPSILGSIYKDISFHPYMSLSVLSASIATFAIIPRSVYFVKEQAHRFILITMSEFFLRNAFILIFVVLMSKGVIGYLQGQLIGSLILLPFLLYLTFKQINFTFLKGKLIESLKYSLPMLPTFVSVWVISASDRVFIERYFDAHDVGIYSLGYKIAMLVSIVGGSFYKAYNPFYFKTATTLNNEEAKPILYKTNTLYILTVIIASSLIALFSKEAVMLFFDERYHQSYTIIAVVSLAFAIASFGGVFNLAIYQEKKTIFLMYANIIVALLNIGLNFLFIPKYGAIGAAWTTVFTYFSLTLITYFYAKKGFYPSFNFIVIIPILFFLIVINITFNLYTPNLYTTLSAKIIVLLILAVFIWKKYKKDLLIILRKKN